MYAIRRVDTSQRAAGEPLGSKQKFWFFQDDGQYLFKAEERGTGEDWAEKVVCHLCELLGVPHVHYELAAEYDGDTLIWPGVICKTCAPQPTSLVLGNQLLFDRDPDYPRDDDNKFKPRQHTVAAVADVLGHLKPPSNAWMVGVPSGIQSVLDVFVG